MQQVIHSRPGDSGSPPLSRISALRRRSMPEQSGPKAEFTCSPPGGMIMATVRVIARVESGGPEPGTGYGWSQKSRIRMP